MSRVVDRDKLNEAIVDLFGLDIGNVQSIGMRAGTVEITYWPTLTDKSRQVTDTYMIVNTGG